MSDDSKPWNPEVFDKQRELMRKCREKNGLRKYFLASGARWTGKTTACLNAVVEHAWHTKNASVSIICTSIPAGAESGVWGFLTETIIPQWIAGEFGLDWWEEDSGRQTGLPKPNSATKKIQCSIRNKHGGRSRIQLDSLKDEMEVERDFKNRYLTMIYWSEVSNFKYKKSYFTLMQALRSLGTPEDEFVMLLDTNPSDEGIDSWIFQEFYVFRTAAASDVPAYEVPRQRYLHLLEFFPDDNPYLTEDFKLQKKAEFSTDPDLYLRYWLGEWVKATTDALFANAFRPSIHVVGEESEIDPEILIPDEKCFELFCGWDFGYVNPASVICEKKFGFVETVPDKEVSIFEWIDELVFIKHPMDLPEYTEMFMEKIEYWEKVLGKTIRWRHWSDTTAFDQRDPYFKQFQCQTVFAASGGKIILEAADKRPGTLKQGIDLWRKLLFQQRMHFSAAKCPKLIEMNRSIQRGLTPYSIAKGSPHKHPFDAARYLVTREAWEDLQDQIITLRTINRKSPELLAVPL